MESEEQCHWLPVQVLNAVHNTATLPDATQVDVMKVSRAVDQSIDIASCCAGKMTAFLRHCNSVRLSVCLSISPSHGLGGSVKKGAS